MRPLLKVSVLALCVALLPTLPSDAQVVREQDQSSVAGIVGGSYPSEAFWTFRSGGQAIVFASLDAEIYAPRAHTEPHVIAAAEAGDEHEESGPARFCVQVIDASGIVLCEANRPAPPPGWQRDPRLACVLPAGTGQQSYTIRVSTSGPEGVCAAPSTTYPSTTSHPFLLNVSLRAIAPTGVGLQEAAARSRNRF